MTTEFRARLRTPLPVCHGSARATVFVCDGFAPGFTDHALGSSGVYQHACGQRAACASGQLPRLRLPLRLPLRPPSPCVTDGTSISLELAGVVSIQSLANLLVLPSVRVLLLYFLLDY